MDNEVVCVAGHVASGGDRTPSGLADAPRHHAFLVARDEGGSLEVRYTALPPGPVDSPGPKLAFHRGSVRPGDYVEVCGAQEDDGSLRVFAAEHSFRTLPTTRVLVVRHAEKADPDDPNTDLDPDPANAGIGIHRAEALAARAVEAGVAAVYTTEFCRTAQTAQPSAQALGLALRVLADPYTDLSLDGCSPPISVPTEGVSVPFDDAGELAARILADQAGKAVLVVGHGDSVPQIVEALSGASPCPELLAPSDGECAIPEARFGDLFVVSVPPAPGRAWVEHQHY